MQNTLQEINTKSYFKYNGSGWDIKNINNPEKIIFFHKDQIKFEKLLSSKEPFSYVCLDKNEHELENLFSDTMHFGIPNIADDSKSYYQYVRKLENKKITFQNLFSKKLIRGDYDSISNAVFVTNERNASHYSNILMNKLIIGNKKGGYRTLYDDVASERNNVYFFVLDEETLCAISDLSQKFPFHTYIDARLFERERGGRNRIRWMFNKEKTFFDVDVCLTLYKKPEALGQQIMALKKQTLRPASLNLYQDGIEDGYRIVLTGPTKEAFDRIEVSDVNRGVWERFRWAKNCRSHYVCIFDDDTIPGDRWLESCHVHMQEESGIYGANGVLLTNLDDYPMGGALSAGWHVANMSKKQVDLVGHSWFFEKSLLDYIPNETDELRRYKYTGEDMFLSYQALEHGRKTFVPPHPLRYPELWGSIPKFGWRFGTMEGSLSIVRQNNVIRNEFMKHLISSGWKPIVTDDPEYIEDTEKELRENNIAYQIRQIFIDFLSAGKVYIYGAGKLAKKIFEFIARNDLDIAGFVVTDGEIKQYENHPVSHFDILLRKENNIKIVLGLGEQYHQEVRGKLACIRNMEIFPEKNAVFTYEKFLEAIS